jgi:nitroreductase
MANFEDVVSSRHSCRSFRADPVPPDIIEHILELAQRTPSWCNVQPWEVVVTSGDATRRMSDVLVAEALAGPGHFDVDAPAEYLGVYRDRRRASGFALYESLSIARDDFSARDRQALENFRFFGAPHTALITTEAQLGPYALVDCGGYISTFLYAAESLGIATIAQAAVAQHSSALRTHLGIADTRQVVCAISFGYADEEHPANQFRTDRAALAEVVRQVF